MYIGPASLRLSRLGIPVKAGTCKDTTASSIQTLQSMIPVHAKGLHKDTCFHYYG
jgi:hypothetical protein